MNRSQIALTIVAITTAVCRGQVITAVDFDCAPLGAFPPLGSAGNCEGLTSNNLVGTGIASTIVCGMPTSGARYARILGNGGAVTAPTIVPPGGPIARPLPPLVTEVRVPIPPGPTGLTFAWNFFRAEGVNSPFNDGASFAIVSAAGTLIQELVYVDTFNTPNSAPPCTNQTVGARPDTLTFGVETFLGPIPMPLPAGAYLSIACWNGGDNAGPSYLLVDSIRFLALNDACSTAIAAAEGLTPAANLGASFATGLASCAPHNSDVWFSYTNATTANRSVTVSTCASAPGTPALSDTVLGIYAGSCSSLVQIACDDDGACGALSSATFLALTGQTYWIAVSDKGAVPHQGFFMLSVAGTDSTAIASTIGVGCGANPPPSLSANPPSLGSTLIVTLAHVAPNVGGFVFLSPPNAAPPIAFGGGCALYVANSALAVLTPFVTDVSGGFVLSALIPSDPAVIGIEAWLQAVAIAGPTFQFSNGLRLVLGT